MDTLTGSHALLAWLPIWATAVVLVFLCIDILHIGRERFEGLPYNIALSSQFGYLFLIGYVLIAATILQRPGSVLGGWFGEPPFQVFCFLVGIILGQLAQLFARATLRGRRIATMDVYNNYFIVPLLVFLFTSLFPIVFRLGTWIEQVGAGSFCLMWTMLVVFDLRQERLDQRAWLKLHGFRLRS